MTEPAGGVFKKLGEQLGEWGLPFSGALDSYADWLRSRDGAGDPFEEEGES